MFSQRERGQERVSESTQKKSERLYKSKREVYTERYAGESCSFERELD